MVGRVFCTLVACYLCVAGAIAGFAGKGSDYLAVDEMVRAVSMENLMATVTELQENRDLASDSFSKLYKSRYCLRVRDSDDPSDGACDNAADYIFQKFASYGLDVSYDPFIYTVKESESFSYRMRNVVATLPGKGPGSDRVYIICSHYDSTAGLSARWMWDWKSLPAPGADDNASGTAAVLEAARILIGYRFNFTIKFITFSGEELGMFGSKHYAKSAKAFGERIAGVINLDMIAYDPDEPDIDIISNEDSRWLANAVYRAGELYNIDLAINRTVNPEAIYSDHSPFWKSGYIAVMMTESSDIYSDEFSPVNHTALDTMDKLNSGLALRATRLAVAALAQLADPITGADDFARPDLVVEPDSVRFSHIPSKIGDMVTVKARVRNLGPGDVKDISVQVWLVPPETSAHPEMVKEWTLDLEAGKSFEISASPGLDEWGDYQVLIRMNPDARVFESDFANNMVRKTIFISTELGIADLVVYPNPAMEEISFRYKLSQDADVTIEIHDVQGDPVYVEKFASGENGGRRGPNNNIKWNGANRDMNPVAPGVYICQISARNDDGETRSAFKKLAILR